ncbi:uncharacterized protein LOC103703755 isoform X3 [Phoenix dactylifera]|nr:uncharacterized protein LOC103703755 isoform X3 [Phoenix dactylifera]
MFPDSDSIDDILLPPPVAATEQTLGKFRPKLRVKTTKMAPVSSSISDATQPIQLRDSDPDTEHQEHLNVPPFHVADSCTIAPDDHVAQESVNQSKTKNSEDFISNIDNGEGLQQDQRHPGEDADMFFSVDSFDNLLQPTSTNARAVGRFKPKATQPQNKKLVTPSSAVLGFDESVSASNLNSSSSPLEAVPDKLHATQEPLRLINESVVHNETSQCGAEISEKGINLQSDLVKSEAEVRAEISGMESLDDILFLPDGTSDSADHPEASHCKDLQIDGEKEEASKHDQEKPVEIADTFFSMESLDDSFQHGPTTESCQDGCHVSRSDGNFQAIPKKLAEEVMMLPFGMELLDDISFSPSTAAVKQVGKFQPKLASRPKGGKAKSVSFALPNARETTAPSVETCSESNSTRTDPPFEDIMSDGYLENHQHSSSVNYDFNGDFQMDHGKMGEEGMSESSGLESFNTLLSLPMSTAAQSAGKFQPKPSARTKIVKSNASAVRTGAMDTVPCECDSLPPEAESLGGHASGFPADPLIDSTLPMPSELAQEQADLFKTCTLEAATLGGRKTTQTTEISSEGDNHLSGEREPTELLQDIGVQAHSPNTEELTQQIQEEKHNSETIEDIAASKPSRKLRKRLYMHGTGKPDGGMDVGWNVEESNISQMDEDQSDDEYMGEDEPKKKRVPKKSKRKMTETAKPEQKPKRASGKPDSIAEELPKKRFPHGTRRKRRQVNKVLLETPEDEIDRRQLRIKDLIMLAEAKERISNKEAAALTKSFPNQSNTGSFPSRTHLDEDNFFGEEEEQNLHGEGNHSIQPNSTKLNYHSYMNRPQSVRWSKADTELFYQAIRQFGTDFAMIQQLFPNRTRHQVKLKFKNEERRHPLQVHDALVHRSKDHAHFERVIQKLQTQAEQNSYKETTDDPPTVSQDAVSENEEEGGKLTKEEEANGCGGEVQSPVESDWKFEAQDPPEVSEYETVFDWDASASYPHDLEKETFDEF